MFLLVLKMFLLRHIPPTIFPSSQGGHQAGFHQRIERHSSHRACAKLYKIRLNNHGRVIKPANIQPDSPCTLPSFLIFFKEIPFDVWPRLGSARISNTTVHFNPHISGGQSVVEPPVVQTSGGEVFTLHRMQ